MSASAPVFDPVPALDSLLFALKTAKLEDAALGEALADLERRRKGTSMSDRAAWREVYVAAIAIVPRALEAQAKLDREARDAKDRAAASQKLRQADSAVQSALGREVSEWQARLARQVRELEEKITRSVAKLGVEGKVDEATGETVYTVAASEGEAFLGWARKVLDDWRAHDGALVATRANEAIEAAVGESPGSFRVEPPELASPSLSSLALPKQAFPAKGRFEALSGTYKFVMSGVMGVSSVGFVASRLQLGGPATTTALAALSGVVLVAALVAGAITVPKQHRQALARERARATELVRAAADKAVREHVARFSAALLDGIKKHLGNEGRRFAKHVRDATAGDRPDAAIPAMRGLMPQDVGRLQGEWKAALEKRAGELAG